MTTPGHNRTFFHRVGGPRAFPPRRARCVTLPASPDAFLDDPEVLAANRRDDYMPTGATSGPLRSKRPSRC